MMNNPLQFVQIMRNPQQFLQQVMNNSQLMQNPLAKNAVEMYQKGDIDGINKMAENLCKERGVDQQQFTNEIKSMLGI